MKEIQPGTAAAAAVLLNLSLLQCHPFPFQLLFPDKTGLTGFLQIYNIFVHIICSRKECLKKWYGFFEWQIPGAE